MRERAISRREALRLGGAASVGLLGLGLAACGQQQSPAAPPPQAAPTQAGVAAPAGWDQLVTAAQKEGKVVVSGPPAPDANTKLPAAFKQRFNIDLEYLGGNSSQLASRIQAERAANQYTIDVSVGGPDTVYATFLPNKWLDPLKPVLMLPEVVDPKVWPTGAPWFRDPGGDTSLQIFNTVAPFAYINTDLVSPDEIKTLDDLLNPKWQGKIASYDPSVNGGGLIDGSVVYVIRGPDFAKQLFVGQKVAYTRDYGQIADWVAHGSYPIAMGATPPFIAPYKGAAPIAQLVLSDLKTIVSGGFGIVSLWNNPPHPNAASVFINWFLSKEGQQAYVDGIVASTPPPYDLAHSARVDVEPHPDAVALGAVPDYLHLEKYSLQGMEAGGPEMQAVLAMYKRVEAGQ